tara:strand:+ start:1448 stop:2056 length:609 start_codon:yes stop_codon:yes gene_type:complete
MEFIDMQLKKIKVYGKLRQFLGQSYFEAAVKSPHQAMRFLLANFEGLQKHMNDQVYKVKMGGNEITEDLLSISGQGDIQIIPVAIGSGPLITIAAGGLLTAFGSGATILGLTLGSALTGIATTIGISLVIDGVSSLLSPNQSASSVSSVGDTDPNIRGSYNFGGIQNISTSGVPVPILYGLVYSGSIIVSSGIDTAQIVKEI